MTTEQKIQLTEARRARQRREFRQGWLISIVILAALVSTLIWA